MTVTGLAEGDAVSGESLIYGRWSDPPDSRSTGNRVFGKLRRNGIVEVDARLKVLPPQGVVGGLNPGDRIRCHTATFECDEIVDKGKSSHPNHRGFMGLLRGRRGGARAQVFRPMEQGQAQ